MADDETEENEGMSLREVLSMMPDGAMVVAVFDEIPQCDNPTCESEAVGMIDHPLLGLVSICDDCLELVNRVGRAVQRQEGGTSEGDYQTALRKSQAAFN